MSVDRAIKDPRKGKSRVTNGLARLPEVDGRSVWARRLKDLVSLHVQDLGGPGAVSAGELNIIRRAATLTIALEQLEASFAENGNAPIDQLDLYQRTSSSLRRLLEAVGLHRRPGDATLIVPEGRAA